MHDAPWLFVENDPGIPPGEFGDPAAGLGQAARTQLELVAAGRVEEALAEGKAIGDALLSANVLTRDSNIRMRFGTGLTGGTLIRGRLRQAATNLQREFRPYVREDQQGIPRGIVRQTLRQLMRNWRAGQMSAGTMRTQSSAQLREFYEIARDIGRRAAGLERMNQPTAVMREEETWFRDAVREELGYWHRFLDEINVGDVEEERLWDRLDAYVKAVRFMVEASRVQALPDNVLVYWMGPKKDDPNICPGCELMMEWSPFPKELLPAVPRDGSTRCLTNCRHRIVVRVARQFNDVIRRKNQLDRLRIETRTRPSRSGPRPRMARRLQEVKGAARAGLRVGGRAGNPFRNEPLPTVPPPRTMRQRMRENLNRDLRRFEEAVIPSWVKTAAKDGRNYKGPNGSEVVGYEWRWTGGRKYSHREGGLVDARVSDWSRAEKCASPGCSRGIVHVYWVKDPEGTLKPYGSEHIHVALGMDRAVDKGRETRIRKKITDFAAEKRQDDRELLDILRKVKDRASPDFSQVTSRAGAARVLPADRVYLYHEDERVAMGVHRKVLQKYLQHLQPLGWRVWDGKPSELKRKLRESVQEAAVAKATPYRNFDSVPYAAMDLRDVARMLQRAAKRRDRDALIPLIDRLLGALEHTVVAIEGRPRGQQVAQMFRAAFVELANAMVDLPESIHPKIIRMQDILEELSGPIGSGMASE